MKKNGLNITFHNPNKLEDTIHMLIQLAAQTAKTQVISQIQSEKLIPTQQSPQ